MSLVSLKKLLFPTSSSNRNLPSPLPQYDDGTTSWSITRARHSATLSDFTDESVSSSDHLLDEKKHAAVSEKDKKSTRIDPRVISDAIIGLSDGLTVPFALTAGLSAFGSTKVVIFGGLAELIAGAISMGLGGYLAARSEAEAYDELQLSTRRLVNGSPQKTAALVRTTLLSYLPPSLSDSSAVDGLSSQIVEHSNTEQLTSFLLALHHRTSSPGDSRSALTSAGTIAAGYFVGGFIALFPYFFTSDVGQGFWWSVAIMALALFAFGFGKTWCVCSPAEDDDFEENDSDAGDDNTRSQWRRRRRGRAMAETIAKCVKGGVQMVILGGVAATAAMGLVKAFS